jgi:putative hemin transport protein
LEIIMNDVKAEGLREALRARHRAHREAHPGHARDAAHALGVSEAELVDAEPRRSLGGNALGVTRLDPSRLRDAFKAFGGFGDVKTMTRNENAVIEHWGKFERIEVEGGPMGQVVGSDIDLRLFFQHIASGFAVAEEQRGRDGEVKGVRRSIQLFDGSGDSAFKLYVESDGDVPAFEKLAGDLADADQEAVLGVKPPAAAAPLRDVPRDEIDAFHQEWDGMQNTHEFFGLLRKWGLARTQALDLAGPSRARKLGAGAIRAVLEKAAATELPIMIFIGSRGVLQIHSGPVHRVAPGGGYLNVLDPRLNVHLKEEGVASAYAVKKPTADGFVTSLELFDAAGETIALLFSKRKPGQPELAPWPEILATLPSVSA